MLIYLYSRLSFWKTLTWSSAWLGPKQTHQLRLEGNFLARGWDSKGVEAQIEEANEIATTTSRVVSNTISQEHRSLLLAKTHIVNEIQFTTNARYLDLLQSSLEAINKQLAELDWCFLQRQLAQSPEDCPLVTGTSTNGFLNQWFDSMVSGFSTNHSLFLCNLGVLGSRRLTIPAAPRKSYLRDFRCWR